MTHPTPQVALKTGQLGVFYWDDALPLASVLEEDGTIDGGAFLSSWRAIGAEATQRLGVTVGDIEAAKAKLGAVRLFVLAHRPVSRARGGGWLAAGCCRQSIHSCYVHARWSSRRHQLAQPPPPHSSHLTRCMNQPLTPPPGPRHRPGRAVRDRARSGARRPHAAAAGAAPHARRPRRRRRLQERAAGAGAARFRGGGEGAGLSARMCGAHAHACLLQAQPGLELAPLCLLGSGAGAGSRAFGCLLHRQRMLQHVPKACTRSAPLVPAALHCIWPFPCCGFKLLQSHVCPPRLNMSPAPQW